jgi:ribosomal protein L6P/L9E
MQPFSLEVTGDDSTTLTKTIAGTNNSDEVQEMTLKFDREDAQQMTCEVTDTHAFGVTANYSMSTTIDSGIAGVTAGWEVGLSFDYEQRTTHSDTFSTTIALGLEHKINAPARTTYNASMQVTVSDNPENEWNCARLFASVHLPFWCYLQTSCY